MIITLLVVGVSAGILTVSGGAGYLYNKWAERRRRDNNQYDLYDYDV